PINLSGWGTMVDYNIFSNDKALDEAQNLGVDKHSIVFPVEFIDPPHGDFRVRDNADAVFRLGFQNFDMDCFGVVSPQLKRLAKKPELNLPIIKVGNSKSKVIEWQGLRIKNLETLGERSATGMDSERGIYVVTIIDVYSQLKDFIRANDVILKFNGKAINNLNDLLEATKMADLTKPIEIEVFRNQMELMVVIPANSIIKK
ncbi:MAG: PDZ domain-containing protein, partial [Salinivirgaceae bacterium]|nr:PDZ domain-containing protein [Salinivirgaceae bacterium]